MELTPQKINHGSFYDISKAIHQAKIKKASIVLIIGAPMSFVQGFKNTLLI